MKNLILKSSLVIITFVIMLQIKIVAKISSYEGLHFLVGFMENESNIADPMKRLEQKIFITSNSNASVILKYGNNNTLNVSVPSNEVVSIDVSAAYENYLSEEIRRSLIEITSDVPISVYVYSSIPRSTDSYSAIPIANWGNEYVIVSLPNDQYNKVTLDSLKDFTPRSSQFLIMAAYDNTTVKFIPKALTRKGKQIDREYTIVLNKGESYLVQSWQFLRGQGDLSGSIIRSDKPIGVLSGHVRSALLQGFIEQPPDSKDHLVEMLPPTSAWGKNYISTPFGTSPNKGDFFKVIAKNPNTKLYIYYGNNQQEIDFADNELVKEIKGINKPAQWFATAPIQIAQFMYRTNDSLESDFYDPSMVILPPIEQFVSKIIFQTPPEVFDPIVGEKFVAHYVNVVCDNKAINTIKLNNTFIKNLYDINQAKIPNTDYYFFRLKVSPNKHILIADSGKFSGIIYGLGRYDSYAMALGSSLENPFVDDNVEPILTYRDSCYCLIGEITDEISDQSYGIYYAYVNKENTNNFNINFSPFTPDLKKITFKACPKDIFNDGILSITYMDKYGNTKTFNYQHNAVDLSYDKQFFISEINWNDSVCYDYKITNKGKSKQLINKPSFYKDSRVNIYSNVTYPYELNSDEELILKICIAAKGDTSSLQGTLNLDFGCDIRDTIPLFVNIVALYLSVTSIDFGDVLVGDTVCKFITIYNNSNIPVELTGFNFPFFDVFNIDTLGIFPYKLNANDSLIIPICFSPKSRTSYISDIYVYNNYNLTKKTFIKGNGVAPSIKSIEIDWSKRRVGTSNDTTLTIENIGNTDGILYFNSFLTKLEDDNNSEILKNINNLIIPPNKKIDINLSFIPSQAKNYILEADYKTNWKLHQNVLIVLKGKGTIPVINTIDVSFNEIEIYTTIDTIAAVIYNSGNEKLYIKSITPSIGDLESFEIDYNSLKNIYIEPNDSLKIFIKFKPKKLGNHSLILNVLNDAEPNFKLKENYITISGKSIEPKVSNIEISTVTKNTLTCLLDTLEIKIRNKSNYDVDLNNLQIERIPDIFVAEIIDFSASVIKPNEEKSYKVKVLGERKKEGKIKIIVTFFENLIKEIEIDFLPISNKLKIELDNTLKYSAGDTVVIFMNGEFPNKVDKKIRLKLKIDIKNDYLYLIEVRDKLKLVDSFNNLKEYSLKTIRNSDYLELYTDEEIELNSKSTFKIELTFLALLSSYKIGKWNVEFKSDECFDEFLGDFNTILNDVCVYNIRHIQWITNQFFVSAYPNPVDKELNLRLVTPEDDNVNIEIYNEYGQKFNENKNFVLKKGIHFVILEVYDLPNGIYFLRISNDEEIRYIKFIKIN